MLVPLVYVPAGRVGLPDLHQLAAYRAPVTVQDAAVHEDALPDRLAGSPDGQVAVQYADVGAAEDRGEQLSPLRVGRPGIAGRMTRPRAAVRREIQPRLDFADLGVGVDLPDLLADDPLAHQLVLLGRNAHVHNARSRRLCGRR